MYKLFQLYYFIRQITTVTLEVKSYLKCFMATLAKKLFDTRLLFQVLGFFSGLDLRPWAEK